MKPDIILQVGAKLLFPFILVFAAYVQFHGDYGPGGGFQAGVIAAAMLILYSIVYGLPAAQRVMPPRLVELMIPAGVLIYAGTGVVTLLLGANYLSYNALSHHHAHGQEWGVFSVEVGVFLAVSGTMIAIFYAFSGRGR